MRLSLRSIGRMVAAAALASLVGVTAGCGDAYEFETSTGHQSGTARSSGGGALPPFLDLVEAAKDSTAFRGVRRVVSVNGPDVLETREDVGADGTGQFAIELRETISLTPDFESTSFPIVYENAARFRWRMRDFRVRNLSRVSQNYSIEVLLQTPTVAGISCARVEFFRNASVGGRPGHYQADIDPTTGFVLAWREFDASGQIITESTYESFEYGGDVSDLTLRGRSFGANALDLGQNLDQQAGIEVRYPDVMPDGFEVVSGEWMDVPSTIATSPNAILRPGRWIRFVATDGIETVTFMHDESQVATVVTTGEIRMVRAGSWEFGFGEIADTTFVVAGRVSVDELRQIVQSAF